MRWAGSKGESEKREMQRKERKTEEQQWQNSTKQSSCEVVHFLPIFLEVVHTEKGKGTVLILELVEANLQFSHTFRP